MADEMTEKKFGYVVNPPKPPMPPCPPPPPVRPLPPIPPGFAVRDWLAYINSYVDVRARQLYDKLKKLISDIDKKDNVARDAIFLRDTTTQIVYKVYMENGIMKSRVAQSGEYINPD